MSEDWREQRERGSPVLVRLMLRLALGLGRRPARLLLYPITLYFLLTGRTARDASRHFLRRVYGRAPKAGELFAHLHTFAAVILDRVFFLSGRSQRMDVRFHGIEQLERFIDAGRGCLLLGAHLGSFDALRALAVARGDLGLKVLMYPQHNAFITRLLEELNPGVGKTVIPLGGIDTLLQVQSALEGGAPVAMLGDRLGESRKWVACPFFDDTARFPSGPMQMAAALQAPVVLFFGIYRGGNRYDVHFELLGEEITLPPENRKAGLKRWTERYVERLEHYARVAPYNWFNFYDFWQDQTPGV